MNRLPEQQQRTLAVIGEPLVSSIVLYPNDFRSVEELPVRVEGADGYVEGDEHWTLLADDDLCRGDKARSTLSTYFPNPYSPEQWDEHIASVRDTIASKDSQNAEIEGPKLPTPVKVELCEAFFRMLLYDKEYPLDND